MEPVFTHGQLYVTLSRVMDGANLWIIVPNTEKACQGKIKNVVYSEVFNQKKKNLDMNASMNHALRT